MGVARWDVGVPPGKVKGHGVWMWPQVRGQDMGQALGKEKGHGCGQMGYGCGTR